MTQSNRFLNRVILFIIGLVALGSATLIVLTVFPGAAARTGVPVTSWLEELPDLTQPTALWTLTGGLLIVMALSICWIVTRGRGRTSTATKQADVVIDDTVIARSIREAMAGDPDVLAIAAQGYRRSGGAILVRVETRSRTNLSAVLAHLRTAVAATDTTIGATVPLVIHLTTGIRTATTGSRTTK